MIFPLCLYWCLLLVLAHSGQDSITATGYRAFIEEYRHNLHNSNFSPSEQLGGEPRDLLKEYTAMIPQESGCVQSLKQGLVEFSDFGVFAVSPGHSDVTGTTHFAFLDAYGAHLKGNELQVFLHGTLNNETTFLTKSGKRQKRLSVHYEASAYGYGGADSQALAPPLTIQSVTENDVARELVALSKAGNGCYCDVMVSSRVSYVLGLIYYPQFGHTLFNGLSNMERISLFVM